MIERIPKCYVNDKCVQVRISFVTNITLISSDYKKDGILCHYNLKNDSQYINKYLTDDRKDVFPYANIPIYKELDGNIIDGFEKKYYVNQILEFDKHYISITDDFCIVDRYLIRDGEEAILYSKRIAIPQELKEIETKKRDILVEYKDRLICTIDSFGHYMDFGRGLINFYNNCGGLLIFDDNGVIIFRIVRFFVKGKYCFKKEYDIPFNDYNLEELKAFESKISHINEPKINTFINPNIDKNDIFKARKMVRNLNRR